MVWTLQKIGSNFGWSGCFLWKWSRSCHCKACKALDLFWMLIWLTSMVTTFCQLDNWWMDRSLISRATVRCLIDLFWMLIRLTSMEPEVFCQLDNRWSAVALLLLVQSVLSLSVSVSLSLSLSLSHTHTHTEWHCLQLFWRVAHMRIMTAGCHC